MLTKKLFVRMIEAAENFNNEIDRWRDFGIGILEHPISEIPWEMFYCWVDSHFNFDGKDWINWYLWERKSFVTNEVLPCYDENHNPFYVNTPSDLWKLVEPHLLTICIDNECPMSKNNTECTNS